MGRIAIGAAFVASPVPLVRALGVDTGTARRASFLARMFGVRDAVLGAGAVSATRAGHGAPSWLLAGAASDLVDAAAMVAAAREGRVDRLRGAMFVGVAAAAIVLGLSSAARLRLRRRG